MYAAWTGSTEKKILRSEEFGFGFILYQNRWERDLIYLLRADMTFLMVIINMRKGMFSWPRRQERSTVYELTQLILHFIFNPAVCHKSPGINPFVIILDFRVFNLMHRTCNSCVQLTVFFPCHGLSLLLWLLVTLFFFSFFV